MRNRQGKYRNILHINQNHFKNYLKIGHFFIKTEITNEFSANPKNKRWLNKTYGQFGSTFVEAKTKLIKSKILFIIISSMGKLHMN